MKHSSFYFSNEKNLFFCCGILFSLYSFSQSSEENFPDSIQKISGTPTRFTISGAADVYYAYDFNKPISKDRQYTTQAARHNEFNLNWGYIMASYNNNKMRGNFGLHTGTYTQFNYAAEPNELTRMIYQANAGIKLHEKVWLDAGILPSHIGYENTLCCLNEIYTRALMAENSPYYSTGAQLRIAVSDKFSVSFLVLNGWQNIAETNNSKSVGMNLNFSTEKFILNYSNYYGNEGSRNILFVDTANNFSNIYIGQKMRFFNHSYFRYNFTEKFHAVVSFDYGMQELLDTSKSGNWNVGMLIMQYKFNEKIAVATRAERFMDKDQIVVSTGTTNGFQTSGGSLNFDYSPFEFCMLRLEARYYSSKEDEIFNAGAKPAKKNFLLASGLVVKF